MNTNNKLKVVIAIRNTEYFTSVVKTLSLFKNVLIISVSDSDVLSLCYNAQADIIIYELTTQSINDDSLLSNISTLRELNVKIIGTVANQGNENIISYALHCGVNIFMRHLDNIEILQDTLSMVTDKKFLSVENKNLDSKITKDISRLLLQLKLPVHYPGYHYLKSCIYNSVVRKNRLPDSVGLMYEKVAIEFNINKKAVERSIFNAVTHIKNMSNKEYIIDTILNYEIDANNYELNTKELVALIADQLRIRYGIT